MEQRLTIITLGVDNLNISSDFYQNIFGWEKSEVSSENIAFFKLNGIQLALYPKEKLAEDVNVSLHKAPSEGFKGFTLSYNARSEKEVDEVIKKLRGQGVKIIKEPQKVFWGGYSGYISDPDGNLWEIAFNPFLQP